MNPNERTAFISIKDKNISIIPASFGESNIARKSSGSSTKINVIVVAQFIFKHQTIIRAHKTTSIKKPKTGRKLDPADYSERLSKIQRTFKPKVTPILDLDPSSPLFRSEDTFETIILETPTSPQTPQTPIASPAPKRKRAKNPKDNSFAPLYQVPHSKNRNRVCLPHSQEEAAALQFVAQSFNWFAPEIESDSDN